MSLPFAEGAVVPKVSEMTPEQMSAMLEFIGRAGPIASFPWHRQQLAALSCASIGAISSKRSKVAGQNSGVAMRGVVMLGHVRYGMASLCGMIRVRYAGSWHVQAGCL